MYMIIIIVNNLQQTVVDIDKNGILYINATDEEILIDFNKCQSNHLDTIKEEYQDFVRKTKSVGRRNLAENPLFIELYTDPITRFEFNSTDDGHDFWHRIRKSGWRTSDLT